MELSKFSEFDTAKALYELLTRDLIEEVRGSAAAEVLAQATPLDETDVAETPVPLPLVAVLALLAIVSLATSFRNPLNSLNPLGAAQRSSSVEETRKAISIQRIGQIGEAVEALQPRQRPSPGAPAGADADLHLAIAAPRSVGPRVQIPPAAAALPRHRLHARRKAGHGSLPLAHDRVRLAVRRRLETGNRRNPVAGLS